jgi:hypothetical protein
MAVWIAMMVVGLVGMIVCSKKQKSNPAMQPVAFALFIVVVIGAVMLLKGMMGGSNSQILNKEMALKNKRNPFEYIKSRLKSPKSIYGKLKVKGVPFTVENIENTINDVAGIRVICSFIDDIYSIRDSFDVQDDVEILQEKGMLDDDLNERLKAYYALYGAEE